MVYFLTLLSHCKCLLSDGKVTLKNYEANSAGLIQSFVDRFSSPELDSEILALRDKDRPHF